MQKGSKFTYNKFKSYAEFILDNERFIVEMGKEYFLNAKANNIPLLNFFVSLDEDQITKVVSSYFRQFFKDVVSDESLNLALILVENWKNDRIPDILRTEVKIQDLLMVTGIAKKVILEYVEKYTSDLSVFKEIVNELDVFHNLIHQLAFETFVGIQNEENSSKQNLLSKTLHELKSVQDQLLESNEELENRVKQRTVQLVENEEELRQTLERTLELNEQLAQNENFLSSIIEQTPVSTWIADKDGTLIRANQACAELFGVTDAMLGLGKYNILQDESIIGKPHYNDILSVFKEGKVAKYSTLYNIKNAKHVNIPQDKPVFLNVTIFPVKDQNGRITHAVVQHEDITEKVKAEEAIRKSEEQLRLLTDALPVLISYIDENLVYRFLNKMYSNWFREPKENLVGKNVREVLGEEAFLHIKPNIEKVLSGIEVRFEKSVNYAKVGQKYVEINYIPHCIDGEVKGFFSLVYDVSESKKIYKDLALLNEVNEELLVREKAALKKAELEKNVLYNLFMQTPALLAINRGKDFVFELANPNFLQLFQKTISIQGKRLDDVLPELDKSTRDIFNVVQNTGERFVGKEMPITLDWDKSGKPHTKHFTLIYEPVRETDGTVDRIITFGYEVTEHVKGRRQIERLLEYQKTERRRLEAILDFMPTPLVLFEPGSAKIIFSNKAAGFLAGGSISTNISREETYDIFPFFDLSGNKLSWDQMPGTRTSRGEKLKNYEIEYNSPNGRVSLIVNSEILDKEENHDNTLIVVYQDVTKLKQSERYIRESEEQLRLLTDSLPVLISYIDADLTYRFVNKSYTEWFELPKEKIIGKSIKELIGEEAFESIKLRFDEVLSGKEVRYEAVMNYKTAGRKHVQVTLIPKFQGEELTGCYSLVFDISETVRINTELKSKNEELTRINNDLDNFIYTASHDLKSPVVNIEGLISALKKSFFENLDQKQVMIFDMIETSAIKLKNTIGYLTDVTKTTKNLDEAIEEVSIREVLDSVKDDLKIQLEESKPEIIEHLEVEYIPFVKVNLNSIIQNLLTNAIKYKSLDRPLKIEIRSYKEKGFILFSVKDNGLGMRPDQKNKLFNLFRRMHTHVEGTGIGLYILKRIVENAGGRVEVESVINQGSLFKVILPLYETAFSKSSS